MSSRIYVDFSMRWRPSQFGRFNRSLNLSPTSRLNTPGSIRPPTDHVRSYLEEMNLATLQLVGSLELRGQYYGLIKDGEGVVHQVGVGAYLGTQWGRVEKIEETRLELVEIVSNGGGGWLLRPRTIELLGTSEG